MRKLPATKKSTQPPGREKATLQSYLSTQRLEAFVGAKVYERGKKYCEDGRVLLREFTGDAAVAEVRGTLTYRSELKLTSKGLAADCTCPAMSDYGFCKHAVALGLHIIGTPSVDLDKQVKPRKVVRDGFAKKYPNIAGWIKDGWIEIGRDGQSTSMIRVLDQGGLVWEGGTRYRSLDKIMQEAEDAIADWLAENG